MGIYTQQPSRAQLLISELESTFKDSGKRSLTDFFRVSTNNYFFLEFWTVEFKPLANFVKANEAHTPDALEKLLLQAYPQSIGDFMFIEWPKLEDELLLTTERSALMRSDVCK